MAHGVDILCGLVSRLFGVTVCCYDDQVLSWAERTNQCLMQHVAAHLDDERTRRCSSVERMMRADLHACTQLIDVALCRQLLLLQRHSTMQLFSHLLVAYDIRLYT